MLMNKITREYKNKILYKFVKFCTAKYIKIANKRIKQTNLKLQFK